MSRFPMYILLDCTYSIDFFGDTAACCVLILDELYVIFSNSMSQGSC
jgi:hypothetical protein